MRMQRGMLTLVRCGAIGQHQAVTPSAIFLSAPQRSVVSSVRSFSSTPSSVSGLSSATLSSADRVEYELNQSTGRRLERARRMEELRELEAQLQLHRQAEHASLAWHMRFHWKNYGPILSAVICAMASMSAAYHRQYIRNRPHSNTHRVM
jgi:hypothetical protein